MLFHQPGPPIIIAQLTILWGYGSDIISIRNHNVFESFNLFFALARNYVITNILEEF